MKFNFRLKSISPLLVHADDVELSDRLKDWRTDSNNRNVSVPGDDRSPPWTWQTYCYSDGKVLVIPADNLMASLRQAGATMTLKGMKSFKEVSQSGLFIHEEFMPIRTGGKTIAVESIEAIRDLPFPGQSEKAKELGFSLFVKRAKVGQAKHVRVRARFEEWQLSGTVETTAQEITEDALRELFKISGSSKGLGDWRPGSPKAPGQFGRFEAELTAIK